MKKKIKLTETQRVVLALHRAGFSYRAIAKQVKKSPSVVHYILNGKPTEKNRKFKGVLHLSTR